VPYTVISGLFTAAIANNTATYVARFQ